MSDRPSIWHFSVIGSLNKGHIYGRLIGALLHKTSSDIKVLALGPGWSVTTSRRGTTASETLIRSQLP